MEAALKQEFPGSQVTLSGGHNGIFDVFADDQLLFSKTREKRFPTEEEILAALRSRA